MTAADLRALLPASAPFYAADDSYAKPTSRWLKEVLWPWFWMDRTNKGLLQWTRRNDCDNFARAYAQAAEDCHASTPGNTDEGLAVGQFYYYRAAGGAHAIVAAVTEEGLIFVEPQTGGRLTLSQQEIASCFLALF